MATVFHVSKVGAPILSRELPKTKSPNGTSVPDGDRKAQLRYPVSSISIQPGANGGKDRVWLLALSSGALLSLYTVSLGGITADIPTATDCGDISASNNEENLASCENNPTAHVGRTCRACSHTINASQTWVSGEHQPWSIVKVRWSPLNPEDSSPLLASNDSSRIFVWRRYNSRALEYRRVHVLTEPDLVEIFDFCWVTCDLIVMSGVSSVAGKLLPPSKDDGGNTGSSSGAMGPVTVFLIKFPNEGFIKGVSSGPVWATKSSCASSSSSSFVQKLRVPDTSNGIRHGKFNFACSGSDRSICVVEVETGPLLPRQHWQTGIIFEENDLFISGPRETLSFRSCSFDLSGQLVGFAFGENRGQYFSVVYDLPERVRTQQRYNTKISILNSNKGGTSSTTDERSEIEQTLKSELRECRYRLRGHAARISIAQFGNMRHQLECRPALKFEMSKLENIAAAAGHASKNEFNAFQSLMNVDGFPQPVFSWFAQGSTDGCISIWRVFYATCKSEAQQQWSALSAQCILVIVPPTVDEESMITDMSWSSDDSFLAVASDDGSLLLIFKVCDNNKENEPS